MEPIEETFHIHYWSCGTWCLAEDYDELEYAHMSDDYSIKELGGQWSNNDIDTYVACAINLDRLKHTKG